jgi:hypothetical protein
MEDQNERGVEQAAELQSERKSIGLVRGVLFFSVLIIGVVSLYTTFLVFASPQRLDLSPGNYVRVVNDSGNETNNTAEGESFVIDQEDDLDEFVGGEGDESFSTDTLPAGSDDGNEDGNKYSGLINPLVVYEEVRVGKPSWSGATGFFFIALLEIIVIYFVYRRVERNFLSSRRKK